MSKARKITIITAFIFLILSLVTFLTGKAFQNRERSASGKIIDLKEEPVVNSGERVTLAFDANQVISADDSIYYIRLKLQEGDDAKGSYVIYPILGYQPGVVSDSQLSAKVLSTSEQTRNGTADGIRERCRKSEKVLQDVLDSGEYEQYGYTEQKLRDGIQTLNFRASDEGLAIMKENISDYTFQIADHSALFHIILFTAFIAGLLSLLVILYALLGIRIRGRHLALGTGGVVLAALAVTAFCVRRDIATMTSLKRFCPGLYMAQVESDYKLEHFLACEPSSESDMLAAMSKELFYHVPLSVNLSRFGCSAFSAQTADGTHLLGRNFDLGDTDGTMIYTAPENGYRSIGVCDMSVVNLAGEKRVADVISLPGRAMSKAFPYITFDGMNEAGLGIAILSLDTKPTHPDTEKPDMYILLAIRTILDRCATVEEATALLDSYDVHSMVAYNYHLFISDKTGHSAVAEWVDDTLHVIETNYVCNDYLVGPKRSTDDERYQALEQKLTECKGILTVDETMSLLSKVSQNANGVATEWSCVYDLDHFKVYVVADMDWDQIYEVTPESFH